MRWLKAPPLCSRQCVGVQRGPACNRRLTRSQILHVQLTSSVRVYMCRYAV